MSATAAQIQAGALAAHTFEFGAPTAGVSDWAVGFATALAAGDKPQPLNLDKFGPCPELIASVKSAMGIN